MLNHLLLVLFVLVARFYNSRIWGGGGGGGGDGGVIGCGM